jgi:hypothetical protein
MPRDVSQEVLEKYSKLEWNDAPLHTHCKRSEVESGGVKLVKTGSGDDTIHPVEAKYLVPEVHSLMKVSRPVIRRKEVDRLMLFVSERTSELKETYVLNPVESPNKSDHQTSRHVSSPAAELDALLPSILDRAFKGEL